MYTGRTVVMVVVLFVASLGNAWSETVTSRCEDLRYTCSLTATEERIEVSCAYPPAGWKGQPVYADIVVTYKCDYEGQGASKVLLCKGYLGLSPNVTATFTHKEFLDAQVRCTKLCQPCPKGWK